MLANTVRSGATGARLRAARRARGLTLRDVASAVGVSHVFVAKVEHDERSVPSARREAFARVLGVPVTSLVPLDGATLAAVADALREAGGCDRAVGVVEEMRRGGDPEALPAPVLDTRMGCVERALPRRRAAT